MAGFVTQVRGPKVSKPSDDEDELMKAA